MSRIRSLLLGLLALVIVGGALYLARARHPQNTVQPPKQQEYKFSESPNSQFPPALALPSASTSQYWQSDQGAGALLVFQGSLVQAAAEYEKTLAAAGWEITSSNSSEVQRLFMITNKNTNSRGQVVMNSAADNKSVIITITLQK